MSAAEDGAAARTGRGGLAIAFAKLYFLVVGLVQQVALKWVLGLDGYGALRSVQSIASITYNPITTTGILGVSRPVAQADRAEQPQAIRRALAIHAAFGVAVGAAFFLLAPTIGDALGAPHLVAPLQIVAAVVLIYGLYAPLVGVMNGQRRFLHQAAVDVLLATLRTGGLVLGAWYFASRWQRGVEGAMTGFVVGAVIILAVALALVGVGRSGRGGPRVKDHVAFVAPLLVMQILLNLLMQADLTLLRRFAADAASAAALPAATADPLVGAYSATQLFAFLPYQLLLSITFILFPLLAKAHKDGDREAVARYVKTGVRLALVLMGLMVSVTSGLSGGLLTLVFGRDAADLGTEAMQVLTLGLGAFAVFGILTTVLNSIDRERVSAALTAVAFAVVVGSCVLFVRGAAPGADLLLRTAASTTAGLAVATLGAAFVVKRATGSVVSWLTVARVVGAMAIAIACGRALPDLGKVATIAFAPAVAIVYTLLLILTRELGKPDLAMVLSVIRRKPA